MTRILQIRRGTSAQNDNFTGLNGEITMDTTNKTVRIHDGETLGGIALARKDEVTSATFDINSVSAEFWTALFETYQTTSVGTESSDLIPLSGASFVDNTFQYDKIPFGTRVVLVCQSPEAGYSIDDEVAAFGIGSHIQPPLNLYIENDALHARLFIGGQNFWVYNKTTGATTNITNANWKLKITVYY